MGGPGVDPPRRRRPAAPHRGLGAVAGAERGSLRRSREGRTQVLPQCAAPGPSAEGDAEDGDGDDDGQDEGEDDSEGEADGEGVSEREVDGEDEVDGDVDDGEDEADGEGEKQGKGQDGGGSEGDGEGDGKGDGEGDGQGATATLISQISSSGFCHTPFCPTRPSSVVFLSCAAGVCHISRIHGRLLSQNFRTSVVQRCVEVPTQSCTLLSYAPGYALPSCTRMPPASIMLMSYVSGLCHRSDISCRTAFRRPASAKPPFCHVRPTSDRHVCHTRPAFVMCLPYSRHVVVIQSSAPGFCRAAFALECGRAGGAVVGGCGY